jgi:hypothetical protein
MSQQYEEELQCFYLHWRLFPALLLQQYKQELRVDIYIDELHCAKFTTLRTSVKCCHAHWRVVLRSS